MNSLDRLVNDTLPWLFRPGSLLYVGANPVNGTYLSDLHAAGRRITLLDAYAPNCDHYLHDGRLERVVCWDVRDDMPGTFDVAVWWHGPEHVACGELVCALDNLERLAGLVVLGCPWGLYEQGESYGNPYEVHQTHWQPGDLEAFGYHVVTDGQDGNGNLVAWKIGRYRSPQVVQVIMVTHGDRMFVTETIPALLETTYPMQLTVVANGADKSALDYLKSVKSRLRRLIVLEENVGKAKAANIAWREYIDSDYIAFVDDDCLAADPDWLRKLVDILVCCPQVGVAGHSGEEHDWPLHVLGNPKRMVQIQPRALGGTCIVIPRRTWERCGLWNEDMGIYGEEDVLYGWKVRRIGKMNVYFDHKDLGRSFVYLGADELNTPYRAWKDARRQEALIKRAAVIVEYEAGRPLNT